MGSISDQTPLVVIVGETASGKSALALEVALEYNGEIICADSRTIYKGMDIGTAKPSLEDQKLVKHHLLDIITPDVKFSVADFKGLTHATIEHIRQRGKLPIMVGGTGLYVDSVLYDYQFSSPQAERDEQNPRHLKKTTDSARSTTPRGQTLVIGLQIERDELEQRISRRVDQMFVDGLLDEAKAVSGRYGWQAPGLQTIGYKELQAVFAGEQTQVQAAQQIIKSTIAYAKRQRTWFKRNKSIHWVNNSNNAKTLVKNFLSKHTSTS